MIKTGQVRAAAMATATLAVLGGGFVGVKLLSPTPAQAAADHEVARPTRVDNFRLTDQNLLTHELARFSDANAIVIVTTMNGCPVVRKSAPALKALKAAYAAKGVEFLMLNSTPQDKREEIVAETKEFGLDIPVLMDRDQLVGEQLGVTRTAEMIVIDPKTMKIVYRGPIDDAADYEGQKAKAGHRWGADALDALLAKRPVQVAERAPVGCLIDFPGRGKAALTYVSHVAPIIEAKCVSCHQSGGIGPMAFTSYDKVKAFSPMIREVIRTQRMPPWRADPGVGHFADDKSLSAEQRRTLVHWIEAGAPRGPGGDPLAVARTAPAEWPLGKPDLVLDIPAYKIPASGIVDYQRPFVLNPLKEDKWLRASTVKVGNRQAVHHVLTGYLDTPPKPGEQVFETKWGSSVGGYAVGSESTTSPTNVGTLVKAGGAIAFQNHYTPFGKEVEEKTQIALYFYKDGEKPNLVMHNIAIANPNISIAPGAEAHPESAYVVLPKDAILYSAFPHAHYRGGSSQVWLKTPDGKEKLLVALPKYDFNWQREYTFAEPVKAPAGSWIITRYTYDNSKRNPNNPDPSRVVPWGEQSFDEMLYTAVRYRWVEETSDTMNAALDEQFKATQFMGILDRDMNGKVEQAELRGRMGEGIKKNWALIDADKSGAIEPKELAAAQAFMGRRRRAPTPAQTSEAPVAPTKTSQAAAPAGSPVAR